MFTDILKLIWLTKSLSSGVPHILIKKMESFLRSFCIASPCGNPLQLWQAMGYLEEGIYTRYSWPIWNEIVGIGSFQPDWSINNIIYVLPADHPLPPSWLSLTIAPEKSTTIAQLLDSLESCHKLSGYSRDERLDTRRRNTLLKDFRKGTYRSVFGMPSKENDLYALKRLVNERRLEIGLEPFPCTPPPPPPPPRADPYDILDEVVLANLFHEPLPDPSSHLAELSSPLARAGAVDEKEQEGESVEDDTRRTGVDNHDSGILPEDSMTDDARSYVANDNTSERCSSVLLDDTVARLSEVEEEADRKDDNINDHGLVDVHEDGQSDSNVAFGLIFGLVLPIFPALCFAIMELCA
ncbi:hypothetical protein VNI00_015863 [Paramarasmius palmivorus]|uniref:Uncharacterized protein n=1 Tax=Paramarasmius palmivorus TaxID=297713 RepID=A0AAW0BHV5_9AGAR